jgi:hypothetical protein
LDALGEAPPAHVEGKDRGDRRTMQRQSAAPPRSVLPEAEMPPAEIQTGSA